MDPGSSTDRIVGVLTATALFGAFGALAASNGPRFVCPNRHMRL